MPQTSDVFPAALSTAIQYASLNFPVDEGWTRYNGLQQLSYFITVFIAAPVSIATGVMQSPAISNKLGWFGKLFNRQAMRSVHFISFAWFVAFILAHGTMVFITGIRQNTNHMFAGVDNASWAGFPLFVLPWPPSSRHGCPPRRSRCGSPDRCNAPEDLWSAGSWGWPRGGTRAPSSPKTTYHPSSGRTARCRTPSRI